jgi:hypothetical protein
MSFYPSLIDLTSAMISIGVDGLKFPVSHEDLAVNDHISHVSAVCGIDQV